MLSPKILFNSSRKCPMLVMGRNNRSANSRTSIIWTWENEIYKKQLLKTGQYRENYYKNSRFYLFK
jgi:hypothetical protein